MSTVLDANGLIVGNANAIYTFTGRVITPLDPDPADICIEDIAHALSLQCRWTGHVSRFYSVAEHSLLVAKMVPKAYRLTALLHDASEAYLADLARPIKHSAGFGKHYRAAEHRLEAAIGMRFHIDPAPLENSVIKWADDQVLRREAHDLMPEALAAVMPEPDDKTPELLGLSPYEAEWRFLAAYRRYSK